MSIWKRRAAKGPRGPLMHVEQLPHVHAEELIPAVAKNRLTLPLLVSLKIESEASEFQVVGQGKFVQLIEESDVIAKAVRFSPHRVNQEAGGLAVQVELLLEPIQLVPGLRLDLEDVVVLGVDPDLTAPFEDRLARGERQWRAELQDVRLAQGKPLLPGVTEVEQLLPIRHEHQSPRVGVREVELDRGLGDGLAEAARMCLPVGFVALLLLLDVHVVVVSLLARLVARPHGLDAYEAQRDRLVGVRSFTEVLEEVVEIDRGSRRLLDLRRGRRSRGGGPGRSRRW